MQRKFGLKHIDRIKFTLKNNNSHVATLIVVLWCDADTYSNFSPKQTVSTDIAAC